MKIGKSYKRITSNEHAQHDWIHGHLCTAHHSGIAKVWCALRKRYHVRYKFNKKHLLFDVIMLLGIIFLIIVNTYAALWVQRVVLDRADVALDVPEYVESGGIVNVRVDIENRNDEAMTDIVLSLILPENVTLTAVDNAVFDPVDQTININHVGSHTTYTIGAEILIIGELHSSNVITSVISYNRDGVDHPFGGRFKALSKDSYYIESSVFDMEIGNRLYDDQTGTLNVKIGSPYPPYRFENSTYDNVVIVPIMPDGLIIKEQHVSLLGPQVREDNEVYAHASDFGIYSWDMVFNVSDRIVNTTVPVSFEVYLDDGQDRILQEVFTQDVLITASHIKVESGIASGSSGFAPGSTTIIETVIENTSDQDIRILGMWVDSDSTYIEERINETSRIFSDSTHHVLVPGEVYRFRLPVSLAGEFAPDIISDLAHDTPVILNTHVRYSYSTNEAEYNHVEQYYQDDYYISSQLTVLAYARYYTPEGEQLGRGPLPPLVGESTKYWVFFRLDNTTTLVKDVSVTGILPTYVRYTGRYTTNDGNELAYNDEVRQLEWTVNSVQKYTGHDTIPIGVGFEVEVIPEGLHEGSYVPLITNIEGHGVDTYSGDSIYYSALNVTTHLLQDDKGSLKSGRAEVWN